jgi:hypothetical protein
MSRLLAGSWSLVLGLLTSLAAGVGLAQPATASVPDMGAWLSDTRQAMHGSRAYVEQRADAGGAMLAVNLDIDNTSLASHYEYGAPVPVVLRFARYARSQGVVLLFNTGRVKGDGRLEAATAQLERAGFRVSGMCGRRSSDEGLAHSKRRCRRHFVAQGYTIVANVGNRRTDFAGSSTYERAFRLPGYDGQLA